MQAYFGSTKSAINFNGVNCSINMLINTPSPKLLSAAFTKASVRYTKQAVLNVETSASVKEIVLVNEKGSVMTAATTVETVENGNSIWTLKFKPGNVGVRTFTVYGVAEDGSETERATVSIEATRR